MKEVFELLNAEPALKVSWLGDTLNVEHLGENFAVIEVFGGYQVYLWEQLSREIETPEEVVAYFREVWE